MVENKCGKLRAFGGGFGGRKDVPVGRQYVPVGGENWGACSKIGKVYRNLARADLRSRDGAGLEGGFWGGNGVWRVKGGDFGGLARVLLVSGMKYCAYIAGVLKCLV